MTAEQKDKAVLGYGDEVGGEVSGVVVRALQNGAQGVEKGEQGEMTREPPPTRCGARMPWPWG